MFGVAMVDLDLLTMCTVRITKKLNTHSGNYTEVLLMRTYLNKTVNLTKLQRWTAIVSGKLSIPRKRALKKGSKRCTGAGIKFNNVVYRDRDQVTHQWKQYFQNLYTYVVEDDQNLGGYVLQQQVTYLCVRWVPRP